MRKCLYMIFAAAVVFLASCQKDSAPMPQGQPIYLSVSLPGYPQTKVPFVGSVPTTTNPLNVDVWASTTENLFRNEGKNGSTNDNHVVSIHTRGHFQSGIPQLLSQAVYPPPRAGAEGSYTADPVYFVSMHPQGNWSTTDGTQAIYDFHGCEDVMFAPQVSGAYDLQDQNQVVKDSPELKFEHLLTRITVQMGIVLQDGESLLDVQNAWGRIKDLQIQSYNPAGYVEHLNKVTVDLSQGTGFSYTDDVYFSGPRDGSMGFFGLDTDSKFPAATGYTLTEKIDSVAYVMCAPVNAAAENHEYVITVETENRGVQELQLDIEKTADSATGTGSTRGNHFLVTLKFKKGRAIAAVASVEAWQNGGYGAGNIED